MPTLETTAQRESLSPLEHHPQHLMDHSRGKQDKNSLRVVSAVGPFSANLHCSDQTCPVVIFKHVFLLSPAFHNFVVKCLPFSLRHLATQKSPHFMGTGSPHLHPSPLFRDLAQFDTKINCKVELGVLHVGLAPGVLCQGGSLCLSYCLSQNTFFLRVLLCSIDCLSGVG